MKKYILLLLTIILANIINGQIISGGTCNSATQFTPTNSPQQFSQLSSDGWLSFFASSNNVSLLLKNLSTGNNGGKIRKANVFSGPCVGLALSSDSLAQISDSIFQINASGLVIGNQYFIQLENAFYPPQCNDPVDCSGQAFFNLSINPDPIANFCTFIANYKSITNCVDTTSNIIACSVANNVPCDFGTLCYSPLTNTLSLYAFVNTQSGPVQLQNYDLEVFTNGAPSFSLISSPSPTFSFPFFATSNNINNSAVTYTIVLWPSGQYSVNGTPCHTIIITVAPSPDPTFTTTNLCSNNVCFQSTSQNGNHLWLVTTQPVSNLVNPCYNLPIGTYTVTHKVTAQPIGTTLLCSACDRKIINVLPPFSAPSISVSSNEICNGNGVQLAAFVNGAISYTWYPGPVIGGTILVTPSVSTIYTVVATNSAGCTSQNTVSISVFNATPNFAATFNPDFICPGQNSTTLTVSPIGPYTLQTTSFPPLFSSFITSIALTPTATTNYTIFGYDFNGCLTSSITTIKMIPCACLNATGTIISGIISNTNLAIGTANTILKAVSDVTITTTYPTYTCDPNYQIIGNEIIAYPGVKITITGAIGGTISLEGVYAHGCGEMWEGFELPYQATLYRIREQQSAPFKTTLIEDARIGLNFLNLLPGFQPCNIPNTFIDVRNATFNKNITGIKISNYQLNQNNYPFKISNSLFTSRNISITPNAVPNPTFNTPSWPLTTAIKNSASNNPSIMQTPWINNTTYPLSPISSTLYGHFGYPQYGIQLENVGFTTNNNNSNGQFKGIEIGQNGTPNFNCFDNLRTDIYAFNSNFSVINSVFQNGQRYTAKIPNQLGGEGILAFGGNDKRSVRVISGGNGNFNCRFYEKTACAEINDYFDVQISRAEAYSVGNDFNQFFQGNTFGSRGFNVRTNRYLNINFVKNKLYNIKNAMMIGITNIVAGPFLIREIGQIFVSENTVDKYLGPISGSPYVNIGLSIADPINAANFLFTNPPVQALVLNNKFTRVNNGISVQNLNHSISSIQSNTVSMLNEIPIYSPDPLQRGILVNNCQKFVDIRLNNVTGPAVWGDSIKAISTAYNASLAVRCNSTANTARGLEFNGTQAMDIFEDNWMSNQTHGLVLDNTAILTTAPLGSPIRPTNNVWQNPWPGQYKTFTTGGSSAQNAEMYVTWANPNFPFTYSVDPDGSGGTTGTFSVNPLANDNYFHFGFPWSPITLPQSNLISPTPIGCRISGGGNGGGGNQNLAVPMLEQIAGPGFTYTANITQKNAINRHFAYRALKAEPNLMQGSPTLTAFYNNAQPTLLQSLTSVEDALSTNSLSLAQNLISAITPTNSVEANYQSFYQIFKNSKDSTLSSGDSLALINLANMCPYVDGAVVFQARSLYNIVYNDYFKFNDNCSLQQLAKGSGNSDLLLNGNEQKEINVILKTKLYPNPNNGNFSLRFNDNVKEQNVEIVVLDILGKEVLRDNKTIATGDYLLNVNLVNGTYLVKVKLNDGTFDVHRLIISK